MKEALVILVVIAILLALTAVRYRKQIAGAIGIARMLRDAKRSMDGMKAGLPRQEESSIQLVNCMNCGVWVPAAKARKVGNSYYCSDDCLTAPRSANKAA